jgi:hypothetical protein
MGGERHGRGMLCVNRPLFCQILMKLEFSGVFFFEKYSNTKFHENPSSGSRVVLCGQTNGRDEANNSFPHFCERALKS